MLTQTRLKELLSYDEETGVFTRLVSRPGPNGGAGEVAGCNNGQGYVRIYVDSKPHKAHRLAWFYVHGVWPNEIDHKNGIRADNRISNLRDVKRVQNKMNSATYKNNKSGIKGVSFSRAQQKWVAQIQAHGKKYHLGFFDAADDAAAAYQMAAQLHFGEFARAA